MANPKVRAAVLRYTVEDEAPSGTHEAIVAAVRGANVVKSVENTIDGPSNKLVCFFEGRPTINTALGSIQTAVAAAVPDLDVNWDTPVPMKLKSGPASSTATASTATTHSQPVVTEDMHLKTPEVIHAESELVAALRELRARPRILLAARTSGLKALAVTTRFQQQMLEFEPVHLSPSHRQPPSDSTCACVLAETAPDEASAASPRRQ